LPVVQETSTSEEKTRTSQRMLPHKEQEPYRSQWMAFPRGR
jgi:hypothetical protein